MDIALAHGAHVVQRRFRDFGDQWNYAVRELPVETPWAMKLDPDERITDKLKRSIAAALEEERADGFGFQRRLWLMGKPMPVHNQVLRVWRHGKCRFADVIVNEHPIIDGTTEDLEGELEHHDSPNLHHWYDKQNRYATAEALAQFHGYEFADTPRLFGTKFQRRMWLKRHLWSLPGRFFGLYLYHIFWLGAWRAGKVGWIWARLRTERYRAQEFKLYEMQLTGLPYEPIPTGNGPAHPGAIQVEAPEARHDAPRTERNSLALSQEAAIRHHERLARGWAERYTTGGFKRRARYFRDHLLPDLDTTGKWLDAGCGSGFFARMLAERGAHVLGVDAAQGMIDAARALASPHARRDRLEFARIDTVEDLPFEDESFDGLICLSVIEYLRKPDQAMQEFARVLKPGSKVVVSLANSRSPVRLANFIRAKLPPTESETDGVAYLQHSIFTLTHDELAPFFTRNGFEPGKITGFDPVLPGRLGAMTPSLFFVSATRR